MKANLTNYVVKEVDGKLLASQPSEQPDFSIFTAPMAVDPSRELLVRMVGSSTEQDLQGDVMDVKALKSMTQVQPGLAIWLNHDYTLPDSLFGSLADAPALLQKNGIADLHLSVDVEPTSENAMKTYSYIQRGKVRLGCSIGCKVLDYDVIEDSIDPRDPMSVLFAPMRITAVKTLEWSVVGIPANQRSWVENAARGIFQRTLDPRLAPTVKSLFPRDYERIVARIEDRDQREALANIPARPTPARRLSWQPNTKTFILESGDTEEPVTAASVPGILKELEGDFMKQRRKAAEPVDAVETAGPDELPDSLPDILPTLKDTEPDVTKGASGKSSWPLADRDVSWDNGEATQAIESWAKGADGKLDAAKLASVHFWKDSSADGSLIDSYKLLFCDVLGGDVKAVPKGIFACAAAMQGSHGNTPDIDDEDGVRAKIASYYTKMAKEFKDPTIVPPWEASKQGSGDKADAADVATTAGEDTAETTKTAEAGVEATQAAAADPDVTAAAETADPRRSTLLTAYNVLGKELGFAEVDNDGLTAESRALTTKAAVAADGVDISKMNMEDVVRFAHRLDDIADINAGLTDDLLHALGQPDSDDMAGSPDGSAPDMQMDGERAVSMLRAMFAIRFKAGARNSAADLESLQMIHDAVMGLTDGMVCKAIAPAVQSDDEPDDDDNGLDGTMAAVVPLTKELELLREAFGHINVKAVETEVTKATAKLDEVRKSLEARKAEFDALVVDARRAKEDSLKAAEYAREATETVKKLHEMPLGRPTGQIGRRVKAGEGAVDFNEMMKLAGVETPSERGETDLLSLALSKTTVEYIKGVGKVRHWPSGVGLGVRPRLTNDQKILMAANDITSYLEGGAATVPDVE